ncbi:MAG: acyltransferase [Casimicrobiaceae bacterium]
MRSTTATYFSRLDHLRFLAALLVLVWHATHLHDIIPTAYVPAYWPLSIFEEGHTGVALFMTLSGFIFQALCREHDVVYREFLRNRILRIGPLFAVWVLVLFYIGEIDPAKLFVAVVGLLNRDTVPGGAWTIIVEFQFYVIFPFLLLFSRKYGLRYLVGLVALAAAIRLGMWYERGTIQYIAYWTIFGRIDQFILGMLGYELYLRRARILGNPLCFLTLIGAWMAVYHGFNSVGGFYDNGGYPSKSSIWVYLPTLEGLFYSLIIASYLSLRVRIPSVLDRTLAWLGTLSYSLYLNHGFVVAIAYKLCTSAGWELKGFRSGLEFAVLICLPMVVAMSAATYNLIERPFLSLRRNYLRPRQ